jgi:hypothetical protein
MAWLATALCAALGVVPVRSGLDIDFGAAVRMGEDRDLFFSVSARYFDRDRELVERWSRQARDPDDLAVALFISKHSGRSPDYLLTLHSSGFSWWDIGLRVGVPVDVWFVPVPHDPGPPYGKAYGYWNKHRHHRQPMLALSDSDLRNLVAVRVVHEYYGVPAETAMRWRASGRDVGVLVAEEYRKRHGHGGSREPHGSRAARPRGKVTPRGAPEPEVRSSQSEPEKPEDLRCVVRVGLRGLRLGAQHDEPPSGEDVQVRVQVPQGRVALRIPRV